MANKVTPQARSPRRWGFPLVGLACAHNNRPCRISEENRKLIKGGRGAQTTMFLTRLRVVWSCASRARWALSSLTSRAAFCLARR